MNYLTLTSMIDSLMKGYTCPACNHSSINEKNIDIVGAAGNTINIDMKCPSCAKHYMARMEVVGLDLSDNSKFSSENTQNIQIWANAVKKALGKIRDQQSGNQNQESQESIQDSEIVDLCRNLKNTKLSAEDLFKN